MTSLITLLLKVSGTKIRKKASLLSLVGFYFWPRPFRSFNRSVRVKSGPFRSQYERSMNGHERSMNGLGTVYERSWNGLRTVLERSTNGLGTVYERSSNGHERSM